MPLMMFGIPGAMAGAGLGLGVSKLGFEMTAGRYAMAAGAGGMMFGPNTYQTRTGARWGAMVGAAGYTGYNVFRDFDKIGKAYGAGITSAARGADLLGETVLNATSKVGIGREMIEGAMEGLGKGRLGKAITGMSGLRAVSEEVGGLTRYAGKSLIKGGAYGALIGGAALGALSLARGGAHIRSNEPVY